MITLAAIFRIVLQAFGMTSATLTISQALQSLMGIAPSGVTVFSQFAILSQHMSSIDAELATLSTKLDIVIANETSISTQVGAIPTGPQLAGHAVTLPSTPPTGYGSDPSGTAAAVWTYLVGGYTQPAGDLMLDAGMLAINLSSIRARVPSGDSKYFEIGGTWFSTSGADSDGGYPIFPIANILPTDTLGVFLERETFFHGWTANADGTWSVNQDPAANDFYIHTKITDAEFLVLRDGPAAAGALVAPPVWPGIANVTLGTPAALSDGLTIPGPLDGVIIDITAASYPNSFYPFGTLKSYVHIGGIVFVDDNGDAENAIPIGLTHNVICPKTMVHADHAILRLQSGTTGTITPWTSP